MSAREFMASPRARPHTTMRGVMSHHVAGIPSVARGFTGKKTKTDKAPMSTSEYSGHIRKYESHKNGAGNRH